MSAPLKSQEEISLIINRGQHAIADIGLSLVKQSKRGITQGSTAYRDDMYRIILLRIYLQNILDDDGEVIPYYEAEDNALKYNKLLDAIARLSQFYGGAAIPLLTGKRIPLTYFPSTAGSSGAPSTGGPAVPGGVTFQNLNVEEPGEVVDLLDASSSEYAFYIINVRGTGVGEGSRLDILGVNWRGAGVPVITNYRGDDLGGSTAGVTYSAAIVAGNLELTCNVPTDGWIVRGSRISFENISFQNAQGPLPAGGTEGQYLRKSSVQNYDAEFATIAMSEVAGLVLALAEKLSRDGSIPLTGNLPAGGNKLTGLGAGSGNGESIRYEQVIGVFLQLAGGIMTGDIAMGGNKITGLGAGTVAGDALRYEQVIGLFLLLTGGTMSGDIAMGGSKVTGLGAASGNGEAVRYEQLPQVDNAFITTGAVFNTNCSGANFGFRLSGTTKVELKGTLQKVGVFLQGQTVVTLPVGYRPTNGVVITVGSGSFLSGNGWQITIASTGEVAIFEYGGIAGGAPINIASFSVDSVSFII